MNKLLTAGLTGLLLVLTGCGSPAAVGEWENEDNDSIYDDVLSLEEDGGGERVETIAGYTENGYRVEIEIKHSVDWEETDDGLDAEVECDRATFRFEGELIADGCSNVAEMMGYSSLDTGDVECRLNDDEDELDCETEGGSDVVYERTGD